MMHALTLQQPWAQLLALGIHKFELRTGGSDYRGRVAIHAASAPPRQALMADLERDANLAREFARHGLTSLQAVMALPRSAVVGVAELVSVDGYDDFRDHAPRTPVLSVVEPEHTDFVWTFANAVEIDPVADVDGRVGLWTLPESRLIEVTEAEQRAIARGPRAEDREATEERFFYEYKRHLDALDLDLAAEPGRHKFFDSRLEAHFQRVLRRYYAAHPPRTAGGRPDMVRLVGRAQAFFDGAEYVPRPHFELELRRYLADEGNATTTNLDAPDEEPWGPMHEPQLLDRWEDDL